MARIPCVSAGNRREEQDLELVGEAKAWQSETGLFRLRTDFIDAHDSRERAVRDLPWSVFQATVHIEVYRVKCPQCGVRIEKVPLLPSKAPFSKRFEDAVAQALLPDLEAVGVGAAREMVT